MDYHALFNQKITEIEAEFNTRVNYTVRDPVPESVINDIESRMNFPFPTEIREFYTKYSNGMSVYYFETNRKPKAEWDLGDVGFYQDQIIYLKESIEKGLGEGYTLDDVFNYYRNSDQLEEAVAIFKRRQTWMPFWDFGNGDSLCIDMSKESQPVVMYYGSYFERSGKIVAPGFNAYIKACVENRFIMPV